jgi:hypothetical protein
MINEDANFAGCTVKLDSIIWLFYYVDKYKFDTARLTTAQPYSSRKKKNTFFYYHSRCMVDNVKFAARYTVVNEHIVSMIIYKATPTKSESLEEIGTIKINKLNSSLAQQR